MGDVPSVARAVENAGLPPVTATYLQETFTADTGARRKTLSTPYAATSARPASPTRSPTGCCWCPTPPGSTPAPRGSTSSGPRAPTWSTHADVVDPRLPEGRLGVRPGPAWTLIATVTGAYGPALGSHHDITGAPPERFTVSGLDTRELMIRQLWGARVLQGGRQLPDYDGNQRWTFTLLPGEGLTGGHAESGTALKGRVRFRLGKPDRGIGPARVAPALPIP